jgi:hypothetical protein
VTVNVTLSGHLPSNLAPPHDLIAFVGNFGSGKTEIAINYAVHLHAMLGTAVRIADLDIVNAYFRSRDTQAELSALGIDVIAPAGEYAMADLPIIVPQVRAAIKQPGGTLILDVGGDDLGARVLAHFSDVVAEHGVLLLQVVNTSRPFTETVAGCARMQAELEAAARLRVCGYVANTHLMEYTNDAVIFDGLEKVRALSRQTGVPIAFAALEQRLVRDDLVAQLGLPVLPLRRFMLNPWQKSGHRPIGVPRPIKIE